MDFNSIRMARNILLRTLAVIFCLNLFMFFSTFVFWDTWTSLATSWYHVSPGELGSLMLNFFTTAKFIAIYILLAPAIALHWTLKAEKKA